MGAEAEKRETGPAEDFAAESSPADAVKEEGGAFKAYLVRAHQAPSICSIFPSYLALTLQRGSFHTEERLRGFSKPLL